MELTELVCQLCKRPGMWVERPYFPSVCAFINGYDEARDGGPLLGFREWLIVQQNGGNNLTWPALLRLSLLPEEETVAVLSAEQELLCLDGMASLIGEFSQYRLKSGIVTILHDYARWLLSQRWYEGPLRRTPGGSD